MDVQNGKGGELYENVNTVFKGMMDGGFYLKMLRVLARKGKLNLYIIMYIVIMH